MQPGTSLASRPTPTRTGHKTRRGKRGGRGRSLSPRIIGDGWFATSDAVGHCSPVSPAHLETEESWGHQDLLADPLAVTWINSSRSFHEARYAFGHNPSSQNQTCGGGVGSTRASRTIGGGRRIKEPIPTLAGRVHKCLNDMACLVANYRRRSISLSPVDMGIIEEHLRGISSLMLELQQILAECARNAKAGVSSGNVMPAGKPEADTKQGVEPTYSRPLPPSPGSYPSLDIEVAEQPSQQIGKSTAPPVARGSTTPCSVSSTDNDFEIGPSGKKKKRRGRRGQKKNKKVETLPELPLSPDLATDFVEEGRCLSKPPSLHLMSTEHDLSRFCLEGDDDEIFESHDRRRAESQASTEGEPGARVAAGESDVLHIGGDPSAPQGKISPWNPDDDQAHVDCHTLPGTLRDVEPREPGLYPLASHTFPGVTFSRCRTHDHSNLDDAFIPPWKPRRHSGNQVEAVFFPEGERIALMPTPRNTNQMVDSSKPAGSSYTTGEEYNHAYAWRNPQGASAENGEGSERGMVAGPGIRVTLGARRIENNINASFEKFLNDSDGDKNNEADEDLSTPRGEAFQFPSSPMNALNTTTRYDENPFAVGSRADRGASLSAVPGAEDAPTGRTSRAESKPQYELSLPCTASIGGAQEWATNSKKAGQLNQAFAQLWVGGNESGLGNSKPPPSLPTTAAPRLAPKDQSQYKSVGTGKTHQQSEMRQEHRASEVFTKEGVRSDTVDGKALESSTGESAQRRGTGDQSSAHDSAAMAYGASQPGKNDDPARESNRGDDNGKDTWTLFSSPVSGASLQHAEGRSRSSLDESEEAETRNPSDNQGVDAEVGRCGVNLNWLIPGARR